MSNIHGKIYLENLGIVRLQIATESLPGVDLMIAIGVIILVLGFLGCCGAIRENRCMLLLVRSKPSFDPANILIELYRPPDAFSPI